MYKKLGLKEFCLVKDQPFLEKPHLSQLWIFERYENGVGLVLDDDSAFQVSHNGLPRRRAFRTLCSPFPKGLQVASQGVSKTSLPGATVEGSCPLPLSPLKEAKDVLGGKLVDCYTFRVHITQ